MSLGTPRDPATRPAAALATVGFTSLAVFRAALAVGAPWGDAAWGGESAQLSTGPRVASASAAIVYAGAT